MSKVATRKYVAPRQSRATHGSPLTDHRLAETDYRVFEELHSDRLVLHAILTIPVGWIQSTDSRQAQSRSPRDGTEMSPIDEGAVASRDDHAPSVSDRTHEAAVSDKECPTCGRTNASPDSPVGSDGVEYGFVPDSGSNHFTRGVIGPEFCNRFGDNMDFDMTVLWIAGWYRRLPEDRPIVLDKVTCCESFKLKQLSKDSESHRVSEWKSSMLVALDAVGKKAKPCQNGTLSLGEITKLAEAWNRQGCVLRSDKGTDLLGELEVNPQLQDCITSALMGELNEDGGSIFTKPTDQYPAWKAINMFRYWSVIGREDIVDPRYRELGVSMDKIKEYLEQD